jgi:molecular chaperone GrpE (heat shock protein)
MPREIKQFELESWELRQIADYLPKLQAELDRMKRLLDDQTGKVQELKPYPLREVVQRSRMESYRTPERAITEAENALKASSEIKIENDAIIAGNRLVRDRLLAAIKNAGIPAEGSIPKPGRRKRYETVSVKLDWTAAMLSLIPTEDTRWKIENEQYQNWIRDCKKWREDLDRAEEQKKQAAYQNWIRDCKKWREDLDRAEEQKKQAAIAQKKIDDRNYIVGGLLMKYGLPPSGVGELMEVILGKDKYLRLAHFMAKNRSDWNDGPSYAEAGLMNFTVDSQQDAEIHKDVLGHIQDWCGDGRIFRDCDWNYDRIFALVSDADLMKDYRAAMEADIDGD